MISTDRLRMKFAVYLATGDRDDAVELASHIPMLLDTIETQAALIESASKLIDGYAKALDLK